MEIKTFREALLEGVFNRRYGVYVHGAEDKQDEEEKILTVVKKFGAIVEDNSFVLVTNYGKVKFTVDGKTMTVNLGDRVNQNEIDHIKSKVVHFEQEGLVVTDTYYLAKNNDVLMQFKCSVTPRH